jgi:hypothetical protein
LLALVRVHVLVLFPPLSRNETMSIPL